MAEYLFHSAWGDVNENLALILVTSFANTRHLVNVTAKLEQRRGEYDETRICLEINCLNFVQDM